MRETTQLFILIMGTLILAGCTTELITSNPNAYANLTANEIIASADLWEDLRFPAQDLTLSGLADPSTGQFLNGSRAVIYSGTQLNQQFFWFQLSHGRRDGSQLRYHWHMGTLINSTGRVEFCIEFTCANISGIFQETQTKCINTTLNESAYKHYMTPAIPYNNTLSYSAMCGGRIFRDGSADSNNDNIALLEFDVHYLNEKFGVARNIT